jgi:hypothetical protein
MIFNNKKRNIIRFLGFGLGLILINFFTIETSIALVINDAYTYQDSFEDSSGINLSETTGFINTGGTMEATTQSSTLTSNCFSLPQPAGGSFQEWSFLDIEAVDLTDVTTNTLEIRDCSDNVLQTETLSEGTNSFDLSSIPNTNTQLKLVFQAEHSNTPGAGATPAKLHFWEVYGKSQNITSLTVTPNQTSIDNNSTITFNLNLSSNGATTQNPILTLSLDDINGEGDTDTNGNGQIDLGLVQDATVCYDIDNDGTVETDPAQGECDFYRPIEFSSASNGPNGETPTTPNQGDTTGTITYNLNNLPDGYSGSATVTLQIPKGYVDQKTLRARAELSFGTESNDGNYNNQQAISAESQEVVVEGAVERQMHITSSVNNLAPGSQEVLDYAYLRNLIGNAEENGADFENTTLTIHGGDGSCIPTFDSIYTYSRLNYPFTILSQPNPGESLDASNPLVIKFHRTHLYTTSVASRSGFYYDVPLTCSDGEQIVFTAEAVADDSWTDNYSRTHNIITNPCRTASWHAIRLMSGFDFPNNNYIYWPGHNEYYINNESLRPGEYFNYRLYGNGGPASHTITLDHTYTLTEIPPGLSFHGIPNYSWLNGIYKDSDGDALSPDNPAFTHGDPESSGWHPVEMTWPGTPFSDSPDDSNPLAMALPGTRLLTVKNDDNPRTVDPDHGGMIGYFIFRTCDGSFFCPQETVGSSVAINSVSSKLYTYQTQVTPHTQECVNSLPGHTNYLETKSWPKPVLSTNEDQKASGENAKIILSPRNNNSASQYPQSTWGFNLYNLREQINLTGLTGEVVLPSGAEFPHPDQNIAGESCNPDDITFHIPDETTCLASTDPNSADCFAYWEVPDACQIPNGWGAPISGDYTQDNYQQSYQLHLSAPILSTVPAGTTLDFQAEVRTTDLSTLGADNAVDTTRWPETNYTDTTSITVLASPSLDVTQTAPSIWPADNSFTYLTEVENQGNGPNNGIYSVTLLPKAGDSLGSTFTPTYQKAYFNLPETDILAEYSTDSACFNNPTSGTWNALTLQATTRSGYQSETVDNLDPNAICLRTRIDNSSSYSLDPGHWLNTAIDIHIPSDTAEGEKLFSKSLAGSNSAWGSSDLTPVETTISQTQVGYSVVLEIDKEYYSDPTQGRMIKWTLNYFNRSATPVTDIVLEDHLAPELIYQELEGALDSNESCVDSNCITDQNSDGTGGTLTFYISNLEEDNGDPTGGADQGEISFWTQIDPATPSGTTIENCANIIPGGLGIGDTTCSSLTTAALDITKAQTLNPDLGSNYAQIGVSTIHYTLTAQNQESFPVYFHFYDAFPEEATYQSGSLKINGATASDNLITDQTLNNTLSQITDPGATATVEFTLKTNANLTQGDLIENQAFISYCTDNLDQTSCVPALETNITQAQALAAQLIITPEPLIFSAQAKDTTTTKIFTLENQGEAPVTFSGYSLVTNTVFAINSDQTTCAQDQVLAKDETCQIEIAFTPNNYQNYEDSLIIESNDSYQSNLTAAIEGLVLTPGIQATPNPLDFGNQTLGFSQELVLTVRNNGDLDFKFTLIELIEEDNGVYEIIDSNCIQGESLAVGESCEIRVEFSPQEVKLYDHSKIKIETDDSDLGILEVALTGQGLAIILEPEPEPQPEPEPEEDECEDEDDLDIYDVEVEEIGLDYVEIKYSTNNRARSKVEYGEDKEGLNLKEKNKKKERKHEIRLEGLRPGLTYYFQVKAEDECDKDKSKIYDFTLKSPITEPIEETIEDEVGIIVEELGGENEGDNEAESESKEANEGEEKEDFKQNSKETNKELRGKEDQEEEVRGSLVKRSKLLIGRIPQAAAISFSLIGLPFYQRRLKRAGVIFDAGSGKPIEDATVELLGSDGKVKEVKTTDKGGNYFFLVKAGAYKIRVLKRGYSMLNEREASYFSKYYEPYLTQGDSINFKEDNNLSLAFPMIPEDKEVLSYSIFSRSGWLRIQDNLFWIGFGSIIIISFINPILYNFIILCIYIFFILIKLVYPKEPRWGVVRNKDQRPQPLVYVQAKNLEDGSLVRGVTDEEGRYALLLPEGSYEVQVKDSQEKQTKINLRLNEDKILAQDLEI